MRKKLLVFSVFASVIFASCSDEETIISNDASTNLEVAIEQIDFNPETAEPDSKLNSRSDGLYHGVFVTLDTEFHAKVWINVNNDGQYNATVVSNQGERIRFIGKRSSRSSSNIAFVGRRGSFDFDVADIENPVASNVNIDGKEAHISTVKDRAGQRAAVILGSFETNDGGPSITGTWDLMTDGTPNPDAFNFPLLSEVVITITNNGNVYNDTDFETFDYPCFFLPSGPIAPIFLHEDPMTTPNGRNEFWAQSQSFQLGNATLNYWLGQSSGLVDINGTEFANHGFHNNDFADPPVAGCNAIDGQKGIWTWNGRTGISTFDDPFDIVMRPAANIDYEGFQEMLRN